MENAARRFHSLDALRAAMMLLGLVLHAMASYSAVPLGEAWPLQDAHTSRHFVLPLYVIHLFRMPAFFAVAGFFAALLYDRDGAPGLARNRAKRVLLPLAIFWALVGPLVLAGFYFAMTRTGRVTGPELLAAAGTRLGPADISPLHLWFLWYLVLFYAATLVVLRLAGRRSVPARAAEQFTTSWWSLPAWGAVTTLTLLPMTRPGIDASPLLLANPKTLVAYGVFFLFGWLLFRGRGRLDQLRQWWSWRFLVPMVAVLGASYAIVMFSGNSRVVHVAGCMLVAFSTWALVLASFGAFLTHASRENVAVRYLSDGAYWIYIIHLPIVLFVVGVLAPAPMPALVKFALVLAATTAVSLATYQAFVRTTLIGQLLNGRRMGATQVSRREGMASNT